MFFRKSVHIAHLEVTLHKGIFIATNRNEIIDIQNMLKQGWNEFLSGCLCMIEGFDEFRNYNTDYSLFLNFSTTCAHSSNDAAKDAVKTKSITH